MARILIIGGAGEFGQRLARRLSAAGHHLLIGGRSLERASAYAARLPIAEGISIDRERGAGMVIARLRPALVIDAAGPFQGSDYRVAEACIAMHIPYLDLADGREFVRDFGKLDKAAKAAGVPLISGASSVPALSGAVVRALAEGLGDVDSVDMWIATSNRASAGESVARSILSYVGKPLRLWRDGGWQTGHGWQDLGRVSAELPGKAPVRGRWVANADIPDLDLLPAMLPGRPAVRFRAGTELAIEMWALWLLSWPVRWGWIGSLERFAPLFMPLYRALLRFGSDRSAMQVELRTGEATRRWTLIAEQGNGPEIPTMAAELLAEEMLAGRVAPGARHAGGELTLAQFAPLFARFTITTMIAGDANDKGRPVAGPPPDIAEKAAA
jgi:hypothetical protein